MLQTSRYVSVLCDLVQHIVLSVSCIQRMAAGITSVRYRTAGFDIRSHKLGCETDSARAGCSSNICYALHGNILILF